MTSILLKCQCGNPGKYRSGGLRGEIYCDRCYHGVPRPARPLRDSVRALRRRLERAR